MSGRRIPWPEIVVALSAALTVAGNYLLSREFFVMLGPFSGLVLGASITYVVQRRLQSGSERRSRNREYVQGYYGPLLTKVEEIRRRILEHSTLTQEDVEELRGFKAKPQYYTMDGKLSDDFNNFIACLERVQKQAPFYRSKIADLIVQKGNVHLNASRQGAFLVSENGESPIVLRYADGHERRSFSLVDCTLLEKKPTDMIREQIPGFREQCLSIAYSINTPASDLFSPATADVFDDLFEPARKIARGRVVRPMEQQYSDCDDAMNRIFDDVREELTGTGAYNEFKKDCVNLAKLGDSLSQRLTKYVRQYVPPADI